MSRHSTLYQTLLIVFFFLVVPPCCGDDKSNWQNVRELQEGTTVILITRNGEEYRGVITTVTNVYLSVLVQRPRQPISVMEPLASLKTFQRNEVFSVGLERITKDGAAIGASTGVVLALVLGLRVIPMEKGGLVSIAATFGAAGAWIGAHASSGGQYRVVYLCRTDCAASGNQ